MDPEKVGLIINTLEYQLELLKLEIQDRANNVPQLLNENVTPIRNNLTNFLNYEPDYDEED